MFRYALSVVLGILCACGAAQAQFPQVLKFMGATVMPNSNIVFSVGNKAPKTDVERKTGPKPATNETENVTKTETG